MQLPLGHGCCTLAWVGRRCQQRGVRGAFFGGGAHWSKSAPWHLGFPKHRGFSAWGKPPPPHTVLHPGLPPSTLCPWGPPTSRTEPFPPLRVPLRPLGLFKRTPGVAAGLSSCPCWTRDRTAPDSPGQPRCGRAGTAGTTGTAGTRADPVVLGGSQKERENKGWGPP